MLAFLKRECGDAWTFTLWTVVGVLSFSGLALLVAGIVTLARSHS